MHLPLQTGDSEEEQQRSACTKDADHLSFLVSLIFPFLPLLLRLDLAHHPHVQDPQLPAPLTTSSTTNATNFPTHHVLTNARALCRRTAPPNRCQFPVLQITIHITRKSASSSASSRPGSSMPTRTSAWAATARSRRSASKRQRSPRPRHPPPPRLCERIHKRRR